jgi:hypothetical protein
LFVASAESTVDASSARGLDGEILIDSPNELTASVLPLATPQPIATLLTRSCIPRRAGQRSSLTLQARSTPATLADYLPSPAFGAAAATADYRARSALPQLLAAQRNAGCGD